MEAHLFAIAVQGQAGCAPERPAEMKDGAVSAAAMRASVKRRTTRGAIRLWRHPPVHWQRAVAVHASGRADRDTRASVHRAGRRLAPRRRAINAAEREASMKAALFQVCRGIGARARSESDARLAAEDRETSAARSRSCDTANQSQRSPSTEIARRSYACRRLYSEITVGSATKARARSCWMTSVVLGKTKQSSRIGPELRNEGWLTAQRNAPTVTDSVEKTTRSTAACMNSPDCML